MSMSLFQIVAAVLMVGVAFALIIIFRRYRITASERRMVSMLERIGIDPDIVSSADKETIMREIRQRCRSCASEDVCERWLTGNEAGENVFCPNAKVFQTLKRTIDATS